MVCATQADIDNKAAFGASIFTRTVQSFTGAIVQPQLTLAEGASGRRLLRLRFGEAVRDVELDIYRSSVCCRTFNN